MPGRTLTAMVVLLLAACNRENANEHGDKPAPSPPVAPAAPAPPPAPAAPAAPAPPPKPVLIEPKGPIDPKSVEAAGQVVQHYGALIEQRRFGEAASLWGNSEQARAFAGKLRPSTHLEIGDLGPTEGAAGSIYTTVPVVFYGDGFRRPANIILRRVNDVPGSTEAQRHWHIEKIDWDGR